MKTQTLLGLAVAGAVLIAACSTDDPASENTAAVEPEGTTGATPEPTPIESGPTTAPPTDPDVTTSTSSSIVPSPEADLPTEAPADEPEPVVTAPGPLPVPSVRLTEIGRFDQPVEAASPEGDTRLFVVERPGRIVAVDDLSSETVLDIVGDVEDAGSEQGLLGLAFHPDADLAYVDFIGGDGSTIVAEFAVDPVTGVFDAESFREVVRVEQPFRNHNGGEIEFGPDGLLYIGLGDGGAADDPNRAGLDVTTRLGKILRIDPLESGDDPFVVPVDNPFVDVTTSDGPADPTIWSIGLRNPWKFSFDSLTGDLWIADVGQNRWEEIDFAPAVDGRGAGRGVNFGWSAFEANERFHDDQPTDGHTAPVIEYFHEDGHCSVSGGAVARTSLAHPGLDGWYVYGDFCSGVVWAHDTTTTFDPEPVIVELAEVPALVAIVEGPDGDLFAVSLEGPIYRLDAG